MPRTNSTPLGRTPQFRAVLFDLFGTLVPCYPLESLRVVIGLMADDLGVPRDTFSDEWNRTFPARLRAEFSSVQENLDVVLRALGQRSRAASLEAAAQRRLEFEKEALRPRASTLSTLAALKSLGLGTAVVTNCSIETPQVWHSSPLADAVSHCTFSCLLGHEKPEPAAYLDSCVGLSVDPRDCLFVGDGSGDELRGAASLGMEPVLIRAEDDDGLFPDRISSETWRGTSISNLSEVVGLVKDGASAG